MRLTALLLALLSPAAWAAEESAMNAADVSWMMVATTLVLFMTIPGIALFYAGMVRKKNVLSVVMQSFAICCSITIVWYVCGYSLAFTEGNFFIGGFDKVFLHGIGINTMQGSIPEMLFMMFQMTFAILTPALMCGAFAERMKFSALFLFMVLWSRAHLPLGLGSGWLACCRRCPGLCRRYRCAYQRRCRRFSGLSNARQAYRLRKRSDGSAQPDSGHGRCLLPVDRLVRL